MYRSSSSSFKSTWGILAGEDSCTLLRPLKRPLKCSVQLWRMASLPVSRVLPSKECRWAWRSKDGLKGFVEGAHVTYIGIPLFLLGKSCPLIVLHGRKLSLECTAGSLICSLGSLIIIYCKQMIVAGAFFSSTSWISYLLRLTSLGVIWSTGQQLQQVENVAVAS